MPNTIAIFGGTFDPIHNGHIKTSLAIQNHFHFDSYSFLPCNVPAIKPPTTANTQQRIEMLQLAIKKYTQFNIDLREIKRDSELYMPSYMIDTLDSLRSEHKNASITLVIGYDAFLSLPHWHKWEGIIQLANLLVINRNTFSTDLVPEEIKKLLALHKSTEKNDLLSKKLGVIYEFDAGNFPVSSSEIKQQLKKAPNSRMDDLLPKEIYEYIKQSKLYQ